MLTMSQTKKLELASITHRTQPRKQNNTPNSFAAGFEKNEDRDEVMSASFGTSLVSCWGIPTDPKGAPLLGSLKTGLWPWVPQTHT